MSQASDCDNPYRGVRAAVLGASGFIGRWVVHLLARQGADVLAVVRDRSSDARITSHPIPGEIVECDLQHLDRIPELLSRLQPSVTFNLAGYGVDHAETDETTAFRINADAVEAIAEAVAAVRDPGWSGQDIVHVGTVLEYGDIGGDLSEDSEERPTTSYGRTKCAGTHRFTRVCQERGIRGLTARLFAIYGPGEHPSRLLPLLIAAAKSSEPLRLTAGVQKRDFTYVVDAAEAVLRLGLVTTQPGGVVNVATGRLTTVRDFVTAAATILGIRRQRLQFGAIPTQSMEIEHENVSLERLRQLVGWVPATSITEGIRRTIESHAAQAGG